LSGKKQPEKGKRKWKWLIGTLVALFIVFALLTTLYIVSDRETRELNETTRAELGGTYITLADGVTHYELIGPEQGEVVGLVHGGSVPMWNWDPQVGPLTEAVFRVLRYDQYAKGYSDSPDVSYGRDLYRRQLLGLLDGLKLTAPVHLVGISFGGGVVADFTEYYPERVNRLTLLAPVVKVQGSGTQAMIQNLLRVPCLGEFLMRTLVVRFYSDRADTLFVESDNADLYARLFREQFTYKGRGKAVLSLFRSDALGDYRETYGAIGKQDRDIMLVWGDHDTDISAADMDELRGLIPDIQFHVIEDAGHSLNHEATEEFNRLLIDFLKE
jgi:pimeloyl-ACP methyl ester carboxylesterase